MVGRDREISEVIRLLGIDGVQGVALTGKPGVGKSRLAREAATAASAAGWRVRSVAATVTSQSIPLGAFAQWSDGMEGAPSALARRVVDGLTAGTAPNRLVVLVDDAHLLDELSALVVHQLVHSQLGKVIATIRTGTPAPAAVTALWKDDLVRRREVAPLTQDLVTELLSAMSGAAPDQWCADELWRLTLGNVLFLRQLVAQEVQTGRMGVRDGVLRWPGRPRVLGSLAELVDAQVGSIADDVRDVVDLVTVAEPVDWHCLQLIADRDAIEEAEQRELIRVSGDEVYVGHPMYAEVRRNRCGSARLRRLRGTVATAMKDGGRPARVLKRGLLWLESDLPAEPDVLLAAATAASSLLDFEAAERLFHAAAELGIGAQARVPLAFSLFMMQKGELAQEVLEGHDEPAVDDEDASVFINDVVMRASNLLWAMRSPEESWSVIDDALATASGARRHPLLVFRANQLALAARPVAVLDTMATIRYEDLDHYGATMGHSVECMAYGELGQVDRAVAQAVESGRALDMSAQGKLLRGPLTEFHTFALAAAGHTAEAVAVARAHHRSQRTEPRPARVLAAEILGMAQLAAGDLDGALRHLPRPLGTGPADEELARSFHVANSYYRFLLLRAQALARRGEIDDAQRILESARAQRHPAYVYVESTELLTEAWLAAARDRLSEARRLAGRAAAFARAHDQFAREVWCLQTAVQFDDSDAVGRLRELAELVDSPRAVAAAHHAAALTADDGDGLDRVSAEWEAVGDLLAAADAAGQAATAHRRAGRSGSAMTAAARSHRLAAGCGGAVSPAITAASLAPPLTNREREIAIMVAQGLSNRDIADAVSLSVRTVESHIYRASSKAGVAGRSGLAEMMRR